LTIYGKLATLELRGTVKLFHVCC